VDACGIHRKGDPDLVLDVRIVGVRPDELDLQPEEIESALAPAFLKVRVRDVSLPALTEGQLPSAETIAGAFIRDLEARVTFHDVPEEPFDIGSFRVSSDPVLHPGPTVGYRIEEHGAVLTYLPDHEPALGGSEFSARWTSGFDLARGADLLIHDAQYSAAERAARIGWGHSSVDEAVDLAVAVEARRLVLFHHDPGHDDATLERLSASGISQAHRLGGGVAVVGGREGDRFEVTAGAAVGTV
jgi:hypothetical protein